MCFALVGKMLFKGFHRTLEFNLLLSISLITASFLAFSTSRTTLFLAGLKDILWIRPFSSFFLTRSRSLIAVRISSESHDGFFIYLTLTDLSGACRSTTSSTMATVRASQQVDNISSPSLSKVSRAVQGTSLPFNFCKRRYLTVTWAFLVDFKFVFCLRTKIVGFDRWAQKLVVLYLRRAQDESSNGDQ